MKIFIVLLTLSTFLFACNSEKKTHQQETVFKYETGELMLKKTVDIDDNNPEDSIIAIYSEYFDKSGKCFFKIKQEKNEEAPVVIESESFGSLKTFKDTEERSFADETFATFKEKHPEAFAKILYQPEWVLYESKKGFTALFPSFPEETEKDINENIRYFEALYKSSELAFMIRLFHDKTVDNEAALAELFKKFNTPEPSMKILEENDVEIAGNNAKYKKIEAVNGQQTVYSRVIQFTYKMHVVSVAVIGNKAFADDETFNKFVNGITITK